MSVFEEQKQRMGTGSGFIAALDQSGGSTPKALALYGIEADRYSSDDEMFDLVHEMRTRIITNDRFNGERVLGAILFQNTLDREVGGMPTSQYLWSQKQVVPFLKIDYGLADVDNKVQRMKPIPDLAERLPRARELDTFGTKMRSVIKDADAAGIADVVTQQFEIGAEVLSHDMVPIIEPEVDINAPNKRDAETLLLENLTKHLDALDGDQVMLKLTLPDEPDFYLSLCEHPNVLRVVALSGGYTREVANQKLAANRKMIASFSRALTEGLRADLSDAEFTSMLDNSIQTIFEASRT